MTFLRQAALLLPSAFLLGVLLFLLTHGRQDPGFGTYAFFQEWTEESWAARSPEGRFVQQSALFFLPAYATALLVMLCVVLAERGLFGRSAKAAPSLYRRAFAPTFAALYLISAGPLVFVGEKMAARLAPGALVSPLLVAAAPFAAAAVALVPAAILAGPLALVFKLRPT